MPLPRDLRHRELVYGRIGRWSRKRNTVIARRPQADDATP